MVGYQFINRDVRLQECNTSPIDHAPGTKTTHYNKIQNPLLLGQCVLFQSILRFVQNGRKHFYQKHIPQTATYIVTHQGSKNNKGM